MSYIKHNFIIGEKLKASALNDMDDQIALNEAAAAAVSERVDTLENTVGDISSLLDEVNGEVI